MTKRTKWSWKFEVKRQDAWIGVSWKTTLLESESVLRFENFDQRRWLAWRTDIWICLLPCLPLHLTKSTVVE